MAVGDVQRRVIEVVSEILECNADISARFAWLSNSPNRSDCNRHYDLVMRIFRELGGKALALETKRRIALRPDAFFGDKWNFIVEFDEIQHFTRFRESTLQNYPSNLRLGFDRNRYIQLCRIHCDRAILKGPTGYRSPKQEFPFVNGRAAQRAFFDALRDLLPLDNGLNPTIRLSEFDLPGSHCSVETTNAAIAKALKERLEMASISYQHE